MIRSIDKNYNIARDSEISSLFISISKINTSYRGCNMRTNLEEENITNG